MFQTRKFVVEGGRTGLIRFSEGEASGQLEWEMLVGEIAMVVYPGSCWWLQPEERAMTQDEIRRLVAEFAAQSKLKVEIAFATGSEIVHPA